MQPERASPPACPRAREGACERVASRPKRPRARLAAHECEGETGRAERTIEQEILLAIQANIL